jgi:hypothetical protein
VREKSVWRERTEINLRLVEALRVRASNAVVCVSSSTILHRIQKLWSGYSHRYRDKYWFTPHVNVARAYHEVTLSICLSKKNTSC